MRHNDGRRFDLRFDRNLKNVEKYIQLMAKHNIVISDNDFYTAVSCHKGIYQPHT